MRHHLLIALGLIIAVIFVYRALDAFSAPGFGLNEIYVIGGFLIAGALVFIGVSEWRKARKNR